jgi:hypothetical protein
VHRSRLQAYHTRATGGPAGLRLLHVAAARASESAAALLLDLRADPNGATAAGRTPLHYAADAPPGPGRDRCAAALLGAGAAPAALDRAGAPAGARLTPLACGSGFEWRDDPLALRRFAQAERAGAGAGYHRLVAAEDPAGGRGPGVAAEDLGGADAGRRPGRRHRHRRDSLE